MNLFADRCEAGRKLSENLEDTVEHDTVIVPFFFFFDAYEIGIEVAQSQNAEICLRLSEFISSPRPSFTSFDAVVEDGTFWVEDSLKNELNISDTYIKSATKIKSNSLEKKSINLVKGDVKKSSTVAVVSDGISSGFREAVVAGSFMKQGIEEIVIVAPSKSNEAMANLENVSLEIYSILNIDLLGSASECFKNSQAMNLRLKNHLTN